jgi:hypothetical protein
LIELYNSYKENVMDPITTTIASVEAAELATTATAAVGVAATAVKNTDLIIKVAVGVAVVYGAYRLYKWWKTPEFKTA